MMIGERFAYFRKLNNLSANKLAKELSVDPSTISKIEKGNSLPSLQLLIKYCNYFNITLADFFAPEGTSEPLRDDLKDFLNVVKDLSPEQVKAFTQAFKTIKK
ncbi:hypothetical protein Y919_02715 [Caloranaerobacter azorensis H53214]|uniref:HTH cro/C1-type domain-containing protein n=1 Tax=Caloranaerobacter azorensis H53214 TaxID=1156417 RepID=A0A096BIU3_9FIRM|nr:helix-turn-helix transcriptional regulator [Caloranaerobacter azorensis]KGG81085.1 hypothetical protein Y919_02715 [Caloranaerobacter azorensis H53214]